MHREQEEMTALDMLKNLHYQVCNGGWEQACGNGYVDDLMNGFGSITRFRESLKKELSGIPSEQLDEVMKAVQMFKDAIDATEMVDICEYCGGDGEYPSEDEEGGREYVTCEECGGDGSRDVDSFSDVSFYNGINEFASDWDSKYYDTIDLDFIDDLTGQSHNHSVFLDAMEANKKNESKKAKTGMRLDEALKILKENDIDVGPLEYLKLAKFAKDNGMPFNYEPDMDLFWMKGNDYEFCVSDLSKEEDVEGYQIDLFQENELIDTVNVKYQEDVIDYIEKHD